MSTVGEKIWLQLANAAYKSQDPSSILYIDNLSDLLTFGDDFLPMFSQLKDVHAFFPKFSLVVDTHKTWEWNEMNSPEFDSILYVDKRNRHKLFALRALVVSEEPSTIYHVMDRLYITRSGLDINIDYFYEDTLILSYYDTEIQEVFLEKICMSWLRVSKAVRVIAERYREHLQRKRNHMVSHVLVPFIVRNHVAT